jgi:tripeptide aminopeptidase
MTEKREGFVHPYVVEGQNEKVTLRMLLRDFDMANIEKYQALLKGIAQEVQKLHPKARIALDVKEQYRNMLYQIEKEPRLVAYAEEAIQRAGIKPHQTIIRGGTDGARLSYMGLPCPNLFAGGEAIHSKLEWVPVQVMDKAAETIVRLAEISAERSATKQ